VANYVLDKLAPTQPSACVPPRDARWLVFRARASKQEPRELVLANVAKSLGVTPAALDAALFADLRNEQRVTELPRDLSPSRLAALVNQAIVASFLRRADRVRITAWGNTRALVRHARLLGLLCILTRASKAPALQDPGASLLGAQPSFDARENCALPGVQMEISGPFALFRRTEVYGRALASLVPRAAWCHHFEIEAACAIGRGGHLLRLLVRSGDPIGAGRELPPHDSRVEARFAKDFSRAAPDWDVIREPRPMEAEGRG
jgi:predicted nuclease of restriction endonuclease-like RecB superfamily